jgi:hypothetical protein
LTSGPSAALANLTEVLTSGRQQGTVDRRAEDLLNGSSCACSTRAARAEPRPPGAGPYPLGRVLKHFARPARLRCRYPEAFNLPADHHRASLRYVGPVLEQPAWAGLRLGPRASAARIRAALQRVLRGLSFREAAGRLRRAIQADVAADRAVAELEALADAIPPLERAQEQLPAE